MPLTRLGGIDWDSIREVARPILNDFIDTGAWCSIIDPSATVEERHPITGSTISVTITPILTGWFRVQPLRTDNAVKRALDSTTQRAVQFWPQDFPVDGTLPDIKPGFEVVVMSCKADPQLQNYQYVVTGAINSSMAWNRTINTFTNLETRPNYNTSTWPQPPGSPEIG